MRLRELYQYLNEDKRSYIVANQGKKLEAAAKNEGSNKTAEEIIEIIAGIDPTPNKKHLQWLATQFIKGQYRLEDAPFLKEEIEKFEKLKPVLQIKDLNAYPDLMSLYDALEAADPDAAASNEDIKKGRIFWDRFTSGFPGIKMLINDGAFRVAEIHTRKASELFGRGTLWCTAKEGENNRHDYYSEQGMLYLIMVNQGDRVRRYQFHVEGDQAMHEKNQALTASDIQLLSSFPGYKKFLEFLIDKHYEVADE